MRPPYNVKPRECRPYQKSRAFLPQDFPLIFSIEIFCVLDIRTVGVPHTHRLHLEPEITSIKQNSLNRDRKIRFFLFIYITARNP